MCVDDALKCQKHDETKGPPDRGYGWFLQLVCTVVAFLASVPLGELFFFHLILMRKVLALCTFYKNFLP